MHRSELVHALDTFFEPDRFRDYAPNGLQVEGRDEISTIMTAATASLAAITAAVEQGADALLVHHGIFWGKDQRVVGMLGKRIRALLAGDCSLMAYHLPMDAHAELGNNVVGLQRLGFAESTAFGEQNLGRLSVSPKPLTLDDLIQRCESVFNHVVLHCPGGPAAITRIGIVTGGGQGYLRQAAEAGCDVLITGETSEQTWHEAQELGIHCLAVGHYASEDLAVHDIGARFAAQHDLRHLTYRPSIPV